MIRFSTIVVLTLLCAAAVVYGQPSVVVSEYFSTPNTDGTGEWTEILVMSDNLDLRNYRLIDNNSAQTQAQGGVQFRNISFWNNLRKGTIIVIHHRDESSVTEDADLSDGYVELKAQNAAYFDTVKITTSSLPWTQVALNIASGGDILELLSPLPANAHVHSLSHKLTTGSYYDNMSTPKPNYGGSISPDNTSIAVYPGSTPADYSSPNSAQNRSDYSKGLPNSPQNQTLWQTLREPPAFTNTGVFITANAAFTSVVVTWNAVTDPLTQDGLTGYIVLRNTTNSFTPPTDGVTYTPGSLLGTATVVANVIGSTITVTTDNVASLNLGCGDALYYRIYPFRFGTDNINGSGYNLARGRAYNTGTASSGTIIKSFPGQATIDIANNQTEFCEGESIQLTAMPNTETSYQWYRNGSPIAGATAVTYQATSAGDYTVLITADNGCSSLSAAAVLTVRPRPVVTLAPVPAQCLTGNSFTFAQSGVAGASYLWNFGADATPATSTQEDPTGIAFSATGDKTVTLTVTKDGCTFTTTQTVRVNPEPTVGINTPLPICEGDSVRLSATVTDADIYLWSGPGLSSTSAPDPWAKPTQTSTYTLTVRNSISGCTAQQQVTITVHPRPDVRIQANGPTTACVGTTITLSEDGTSGGGQFEWLPDHQLGPVLTVAHDRPGLYLYRVVLRNGNGCIDTSNTIPVTVIERPESRISAPEGTAVCPGGKVVLSAVDVPGASYKWSNGATTKDVSVGKGTYRVTVSLGTGCDSLSLPVTITERVAAFSVSQRAVQFDDLGKCEGSTAKTITLTNTGQEQLTILGTASPHFVVAPSPLLLAAGETKTVTLRFAPTSGSGTYNGRIYFTAQPCAVIDSVDVGGTKVGVNDVAPDPVAVAWTGILPCAERPADTTVTISNSGTNIVRITSVSVAAPFALRSHTPADFPLDIQPGESVSFDIRFAPQTAGASSTDAVFRYENGECRDSIIVPLSGTHAVPALSIEGTTIDFPALPGCEEYRDSIMVVTNTGNATVTVDAASNPPGEFLVLSHSSQILAPGEQDTIRIRFRPAGSGMRQAQLVVRETLCGTTASITLRGTKQGISFAVDEAVVFTPLVAPCSGTSTTAILSISNTSEVQATASVVSASLINGSSAFAVSIPSGTPLPHGDTRTFTVTFTPPSDGVYSDTLLLHLTPCDVIKSIPLSGTKGRASIEATGSSIVLAPLPVGNTVNADIVFTNTGSVPLTIDNIGGVAPPFTVVSVRPPLPAYLEPDSVLTVTVKYTADDEHADTVHVYTISENPCLLQSDNTMLVGSGLQSSGPLPVALTASLPPALSGSPGEFITFPIIFTSDGLDTAGITGVDAELSYNGSLLLPVDAAAGPAAPGFTASISEQRPGILRVSLAGSPSALAGAGTVADVRFRVLLGNAVSTPVDIDTLEFTAPQPVVYQRSGAVFTLRDSCSIDSRLVDVAGATAVAVVGVDADKAVADVSTAYDGHLSVHLYDALGRQVSTPVDGYIRTGVHRLTIPVAALPGGVYFLVVRSEGLVTTAGFTLVR